jgi:hypothetical protein
MVGKSKMVKKEVESKPVTIPFTTYDNSGAVSKLAM